MRKNHKYSKEQMYLAIKKVFRETVRIARFFNLIGGTLIACFGFGWKNMVARSFGDIYV